MERMATERITWQDTLLMPEDGKRYEAIDGELYVTAAPLRRHQRVSLNLETALHALLDKPGLGWVYHAPIGVEFPETEEGVQPDIVFVSRRRAQVLVKEGIRGAPDLVIEILSPSTAGRDRTIKRKLYERQGVSQYWIVDPDSESVEVWGFDSRATKPARYVDRLPVNMDAEPVGEISLPKVFEPEL